MLRKQKLMTANHGVTAPSEWPWLLNRQLQAHVGNSATSSIANLVNAVITMVILSGLIAPIWMAAGFVVLLTLVLWCANIAKKVLQANEYSPALNSLATQITVIAGLLGALWGVCTGLVLIIGGAESQLFAAILGSGMMSAGAMMYRTRQNAACLYVLTVLPGVMVGLVSVGTHAAMVGLALLICYTGVLLKNIRETSKRSVISYQRERALAKSSDTIQLLLNDFTEQGSDWLFELATGERIANPSARFAAAACRPLETMAGKRFPLLFDEGPECDQLQEHLASGRAFRSHVVSLTIDGNRHWWSISARPSTDDDVLFRGVVTDITMQRKAEERVSFMAHYDSLTNLPNRFLFNDTLYRTLNADNNIAGVLYLDLDNFKAINDTLGHSVGDQLLQAVARRLEDCVSGAETISRLGGDEFAVIVPAKRLNQISQIAASIIMTLDKPFSLNDHDVVVGASIGIAKAPAHADNAETLLRNADLALYAAKSMGRNRAVEFEPGMDKAAQMRRMIELDLRSALGKQQMRLHYQPLVNVETGETSGYEALIRWEHPERGIVMPNTFIPIAEETGMIVQIGEWVIRQALDDLATWQAPLSVSINLSPVQMRSPTLISTVLNALASTGVDASRVCIEITESVLMQDTDANIETLHKLRGLGVQIALDDFGTGYSSLNYLRSFPFSKIKIDRCFINEIDSREDCQAIVRSVVGLANSLGMTTTAEGVERTEQLEQLRSEGCFEVQGYLYSQAVPIDELSDLRSHKRGPQAKLLQLEETRRANEAALQNQAIPSHTDSQRKQA